VGEGRPQAREGSARIAQPDVRHRPRAAVPAAAEEGPRPAAVRRRGRPGRPKPRRPAGAGRRAPKDPFGAGFEGLIPNFRRRYEEGSWLEQEDLEPYRALRPCPTCAGERLKAQSRAVRVKGRTISEYVNLPISEAVRLFDEIELSDREALIASRILREIRDRLHFLYDVGVGYLTLGRSAATLSGGRGSASGWRRRSAPT
jgi:hypothetical protein